MPVHDWTKVLAGDFHDFHQCWTVSLRMQLNLDVLPAGYYAQIERAVTDVDDDVLTRTASVDSPVIDYAYWRKNQVAIHSEPTRQTVAIIEMVGPHDKSNSHEIERFVQKAVTAIHQGIHLLIIDLFPPTKVDPQGIHAEIWRHLGDDINHMPTKAPLTQIAYVVGDEVKAYVEPLAVGGELLSMPLFLTSVQYAVVPLAETYEAALRGIPAHVRRALQQTITPSS